VRIRDTLSLAVLSAAIISTQAIAGGQASGAIGSPAPSSADAIRATTANALSKLPAGAPVFVMTNEELSTKASKVGDRFLVTVLHDVVDGATIVIPKGTTGFGEVTFATDNGGFGKPGILGISLRYLELNGAKVLLDGRYREEGANKNGATAATWFAVGVFSGFIKGKPGVIPKGRELKARTGEDIAFLAGTQPRVAGTPSAPVVAVDAKMAAPSAPVSKK